MAATCPTCGQKTKAAGNREFPFCSPRCQLIDLGRWLGEEYRIPVTDASGGGVEGAPAAGEDGDCSER